MGYIKFKKKKTVTKVIVSEESPHVIRITGDNITINTDGFRLYLDADCKYPLDNGEYEAYTTLFREGNGWYELSDDGSVYIEPVVPVQPEPTEEELAEQERQQQISQLTAQIDDLKSRIATSDYKVIKHTSILFSVSRPSMTWRLSMQRDRLSGIRSTPWRPSLQI